jgi:hypothetical protein
MMKTNIIKMNLKQIESQPVSLQSFTVFILMSYEKQNSKRCLFFFKELTKGEFELLIGGNTERRWHCFIHTYTFKHKSRHL